MNRANVALAVQNTKRATSTGLRHKDCSAAYAKDGKRDASASLQRARTRRQNFASKLVSARHADAPREEPVPQAICPKRHC